MSLKGWAIAIAIIGSLGYGAVELAGYIDKHSEASDDCYTMANNNAHDPHVQLAMSDGFLSDYECNKYVRPADDARIHNERFDLFMNAAKSDSPPGG